MRPVSIGLAFVLSFLTFTSAALAAPKADPISKEDRAAGMAAAPGLISGANLDCQRADARKIGEGKDETGKKHVVVYELACTGNEGVIVNITDKQTPMGFSCFEFNAVRPDGKPNPTQCLLPGNADPKAGLAPYLAKVGVDCTPSRIRGVGHSATVAMAELECAGAPGGYMLEISSPPRLDKPIKAMPCMVYPETDNLKCTLTDRATQNMVVDRLVAASGKPCPIKPDGRAVVGVGGNGSIFYEVACTDGKGYMLEQAANGKFHEAIPCIEADGIAGGCKMTDTRQAKTEQNNLYGKLAKDAGYDCAVSGYAPLPLSAEAPAHSDVVELSCSNRADGAIAIFPASTTEKGMIVDCAHSELILYRCSLTKASAAYNKLTAELVSYGRNSCNVSDARTVGVTADKRGFIEVACSDGGQGYMIEYTISPLKMKTVIICAEAKSIAGGCTLPSNVKKS